LHAGEQGRTDALSVPSSLPLSSPNHNEATCLANCLREMEQVKEEARGMRAKVRGLEVKVRRMKRMKAQVREMRKRMRQLEDRSAEGSVALHQQQRSQQTVVPCLCPLRTKWLGGRGEEGVCGEMQWCFPFLKHYGDISPGSFVVDDVLRKGVYVITIQDKRPAVTFANQQLCQTTGYSLAELLDHKLVIQVCRPIKITVMSAFKNRRRLGMSEILHCSILLEHKQGHMVATSSRLQFCFVGSVRYSVVVVDQVLGAVAVPSTISDVSAKELEEWHEASREVKRRRLAARCTYDSMVRQPQLQEQNQAVAAEEPSWDDLLHALSTSSPFFSPAEGLHTGRDGAWNN